MATVCVPELAWPDHLILQEAMVEAVANRRRGLPHLDRGLQVMRNTEVATRRMVQPLDDTLGARVDPLDIDALVVVSCTGYMLPGPDACIAGELGLRSTVRRLPIQQLGCAAGGSALAQAADFLRAYPYRFEDGRPTNVLVIAVELCSLSYQPERTSISDFISVGLFGDGAAAAVVRGDDREPGVRLIANRQHLVPDSTQVIAGTTGE